MLDSSIWNEEIIISDYDIVKKDRNRHGGGVATLIKWEINYKLEMT